jgi:hypothetical protein
MPMDDGDDRFARVRRLIAEEVVEGEDSGNTATWLRHLCASATRALPASGVGVCLLGDDGARGVAAASDDASAVLEELQFTFGEGPCLSAFADRRPVLEAGIGTSAEGRWPVYWPAVVAKGVRAVFAFPLQIGAARLGVMDVYRDQPGGLSKEALSLALTYAEVAVHTLLDGQQRAQVGDSAAGLAEALAYRLELYQAQGMVMVQLGVPLDEAMAVMRAHAFARDRSLIEVARDVVARRLTFDRERP